MFTPETADLPDRWPACRYERCGSKLAAARIDRRYGPITIACENGHFRRYARADEFRARGRYAGLLTSLAAWTALERRLDPGAQRREEVLDDADRCALCKAPPVRHPLHDEPAVRTDREVWAWLQRWRTELFAQLIGALAIVRRRERVTYGNWRLKIPAELRERVVHELEDSTLVTDHLIPLAALAPLGEGLAGRELDFAVQRLLLALCRRCSEARSLRPASRESYLRDYVTAMHDGDERRARASSHWRTVENLVARCTAEITAIRTA